MAFLPLSAVLVTFTAPIFHSRFANPFFPLQHPKTPPTPKFVPTIVIQGFNQGDPNLSKICRKFENLSGNCRFSIFRQIFDKFGFPWLEARKTIVGTKFWTKLGFGEFLNAVRGKRVRKARMKTSFSLEMSQSRPREFPTNMALARWLAWNFHSRLKVSFSLEVSFPDLGVRWWKPFLIRPNRK